MRSVDENRDDRYVTSREQEAYPWLERLDSSVNRAFSFGNQIRLSPCSSIATAGASAVTSSPIGMILVSQLRSRRSGLRNTVLRLPAQYVCRSVASGIAAPRIGGSNGLA